MRAPISAFCSILLLLLVTCRGQPVNSPASSPDAATPQLSSSTEGGGAELTLESQASNAGYSQTQFKLSLLPEPEKTAESVNLEREGIPSKVLTAYDTGHQKLSDFSNPVPILDTISEHEKYGNQGDMFDGISRTIVNGYEAFSNLLNQIIQKPQQLARSISKGITAQLDIIGGKIVGL